MTNPMCAHDVRRLAVAATTDPRTILRYLRGEAIRSTSKARIDAAVRSLGMLDAVRVARAAAPAEGAQHD